MRTWADLSSPQVSSTPTTRWLNSSSPVSVTSHSRPRMDALRSCSGSWLSGATAYPASAAASLSSSPSGAGAVWLIWYCRILNLRTSLLSRAAMVSPVMSGEEMIFSKL